MVLLGTLFVVVFLVMRLYFKVLKRLLEEGLGEDFSLRGFVCSF